MVQVNCARVDMVQKVIVSKWRRRLPQILAVCGATLSGIAYGMCASWATPSLPLLKSATTSPIDGGRAITDEEASWLNSLLHLGGFFASPVFGCISQRYGRKMCGYVTVIPLLIGWLPILFSDSIYLFFIGRFILGTGLGGVLAFCPMYVGEISEDSIRGALGTFRSNFLNISAILMVAIGPFLSIRQMGLIIMAAVVVFAMVFFWLPESPLFLMRKGNSKEAMDALTRLRGGNKQAAEEEVAKLAVVIENSQSENTSIRRLLASRATRRGLMICAVLSGGIQLTGVYPMLSYSVGLFESAGGSVSPTTASMIVSSMQLIGSITSGILLDYAGRRIVLVSTQICMTISLFGLGAYFFLQELSYDLTDVGSLPIILASFFLLTATIGPVATKFVVMAEIFSPEARGLATSVSTMLFWAMAFIMNKIYVNLVDLLGLHGCYWLFCVMCIACTVFVYFVMPETKNKSLDNILKELNGDQVMKELNGDQVMKELNGDQVMKELNGDQVMKELNGDQVRKDLNGDQVMKELNGDQVMKELNGDQVMKELNGDQVRKELNGDQVNEVKSKE